MKNTSENEMSAALQGVRNRLDTLASINADNICIPGGPQEQYHQIVEEAYVALGLIETQIDGLGAELEYQHKRLDEIRDAAMAETIERQQGKQRPGFDAEDLSERVHEDWANEE
jgi:hypothetical protein